MKKIFLMLSLLSCQNTLLNMSYKGGGEVRVNNVKTDLMIAAEKGDLTAVKKIVNGYGEWCLVNMNGVDSNEIKEIDRVDINGWTALMYAARNGHNNCLQVLLNKGANVQNGDIVLSAKSNNIECLKLLMDKIEGSSEQKQNVKLILLCITVENINEECAKYLIEQGTNFTSLAFSKISENQIEQFSFLIKCLIDLQEDINSIKNKIGYTLLGYAIKSEESREKFINFLINCKQVDVNSKDKNGWSALMLAASLGKIDYLAKLLKAGADINAHDEDKYTALAYSIMEKNEKVTIFLLNNNANPNGEEDSIPLNYAIEEGVHDIARLLLKKGAFPDHENNKGETPLIVAAKKGDKEGIKLLLNYQGTCPYKIDVNCYDKNKKTALMYAAENGDKECLNLLIKHEDIRLDMTNVEEGTALMCAAANGNSDCLGLLISKEAEADGKDLYGNTALILAANKGSVECVNLLLKKDKKNIDSANAIGSTALMHAAELGNKDCVNALLKAGAKKDIKNAFGCDALLLAKDECKNLLK